MLNWTGITSRKDYEDKRFDLLTLLEGSTRAPYVDTIGDPTIGIGFNLVYNLEPVLRAIVGKGNWSDTLHQRLSAQIDKTYAPGQNGTLSANLDGVMKTWHETRDSDIPTTFAFRSDAQIARVLDAIAPTYDGYVDRWIAGIPDSEERAVLFSLAWNGPGLLGPKLKAAVLSGDRAEAWFEIRYNSNGSGSTGIANRRYVEAEDFGLFDKDGTAGYAEAVRAGRMLAAHHDTISAYETRFDAEAAGQIKGMAGIDAIAGELNPAIVTVCAQYEIPAAGRIEEFLATGPGRVDLAGDGTGDDNSGNDADLLLGDAASNRLSGGAGRDVLIGLGGTDSLAGGAGGDLFVFTSSRHSTPAAADRIEDFGHGADRMAFNALDAGLYLLEDRGSVFSGERTEIRWVWKGDRTLVDLDADADGQADLRVILEGRVRLSGDDFLL